jgi:hypothetical protein
MTQQNKQFDFNGQKIMVELKIYSSINRIADDEKSYLKSITTELLKNCWGEFPPDFIEEHILNSEKIIIAKTRNKYIGIVGMSKKQIEKYEIHYIEFLLVARGFQKSGLGSYLSFKIIQTEVLKRIFKMLIGGHLDIFFITPNIRLLSKVAKFASHIYPDPFNANEKGRIPPADEETWFLAQKILEMSDNPNRALEREGLVLNGSYAQTPWLIYNNDNAPWHNSSKMNKFVSNYLRYEKGEDREFVVRAKINSMSLLRYLKEELI